MTKVFKVANNFKFKRLKRIKEDGQDYEEVKVEHELGQVKMSNYFPSDIKSNIKYDVSQKYKNFFSLGPIYYNTQIDIPIEYQYGITETAKDNESSIETAKRGLMEEVGLMFRPNPIFQDVKQHTYNTRNGKVHCTLFLVHVNQVKAIDNPSECKPYIKNFNLQNGQRGLNKAHVIIYGKQDEIISLIESISLKPVDANGEYYDKDVNGLSCFPI